MFILKIINYLNLPKNLRSLNTYTEIINNRLGFAFKKVPINSDLNLIPLNTKFFSYQKEIIPYLKLTLPHEIWKRNLEL